MSKCILFVSFITLLPGFVFSQDEIMNPGIGAGTFWRLTGNANTSPSTNFLGTTDSQPLVISTNSTENMRINTNGNVGIGTTATTGRLFVNTPSSNTTTGVGIYNILESNVALNTYAVVNYNRSTTDFVKYGIFNEVSNIGIGGRFGIYNSVDVNASSVSSAIGIRNILTGNGSGIQYGLYNSLTQSGTGIVYGSYNFVDVPVTNTASAYGEYTLVDFSAGTNYGEYKEMRTNATNSGSVIGDYNLLNGTGNSSTYGVYNQLFVTGTGIKAGVNNEFQDIGGTKRGLANVFASGTTTGTQTGVYNFFQNTSVSSKFGMQNSFNSAEGIKYGVYNSFTGSSGTFYGLYNLFSTGTDAVSGYGSYASLSGAGPLYGYYASIFPSTGATSNVFGFYTSISSNGTGAHYGGYFNVPGDGNYAVYALNTTSTGWAGYLNGNVQIQSSTRTHVLYADYTNNVVRFGTATGSLSGNGATVSGVTVDYVADFDRGTAEGTAIGIGSVEYLLDGVSLTGINNSFAPTTHISYDLGFSTTTEAWDDVYADDFWNVSDIREKENIKEMSYGLTELLKLRTISYTLKNDPFKDAKIGLVAQNVLPLIPEAVKTHDYKITDEDKPNEFNRIELNRMGISYGTMVPVLVKSIQEQQTQIEQQQAQIDELKRQNERLLRLIQEIKKR